MSFIIYCYFCVAGLENLFLKVPSPSFLSEPWFQDMFLIHILYRDPELETKFEFYILVGFIKNNFHENNDFLNFFQRVALVSEMKNPVQNH